LGTRCEILLLAGCGDLRAAGDAAVEEIETWHRRLSRFSDDSLLSHINRTAARVPVRLDRDTYALFEDARAVWRASDGAFDVTIAPLMVRQGFQDSAVPASKCRVGGGALTLDRQRWTIGLSPGASIDLGGIAKGHALDCAAAVLRHAGVTSALLHGGTSSIVAIGTPPGEPSWRVAIGTEHGAPVVALRDTAMSVSDVSSQRGGPNGEGHILDPRTGCAAAGCGRVVVAGPSARLTDAWSTALAVLQRVPVDFPAGYTASFSAVGTVPTVEAGLRA
jgi:thiamine biosynthesis lipoprotein